jgi:hypothetical protein
MHTGIPGKKGKIGEHGPGTVTVINNGESINPGNETVPVILVDDHVLIHIFAGKIGNSLLFQFPQSHFLNSVLFAVNDFFHINQSLHAVVVGG